MLYQVLALKALWGLKTAWTAPLALLRARAFEPLLTTALCTAALPVLSLLGKVQELRLPFSNPSLKYVVAITPVPVSATTWGLSAALSVKVRLALRVPLAAGEK